MSRRQVIYNLLDDIFDFVSKIIKIISQKTGFVGHSRNDFYIRLITLSLKVNFSY